MTASFIAFEPFTERMVFLVSTEGRGGVSLWAIRQVLALEKTERKTLPPGGNDLICDGAEGESNGRKYNTLSE
jgi:hypothetical protein